MSLAAAILEARESDLTEAGSQAAVTRDRLIPRLDEILAHVRKRRAEVDGVYEELRAKADDRPTMYGEAHVGTYPIGFCLGIRDGVFDRLAADPEFLALIGAGTVFKRVHILLRDSYFQNAMQVGNLYVDAANDTVDVRKDKLDWAPIGRLDYRNCESWEQLHDVARRYLGVELYPNLLLPLAFPLAPFFMIRPSGRIDLFPQSIVFMKDLGEGMTRAKALLQSPLMTRRLPEAYEALLKKAFDANLRVAFPIAFEPISPAELETGVLTEFENLRDLPEPASSKTIEHYLKLMADAERSLARMNLTPSPDVLASLRAEGLVPKEAYIGGKT